MIVVVEERYFLAVRRPVQRGVERFVRQRNFSRFARTVLIPEVKSILSDSSDKYAIVWPSGDQTGRAP